MKKIISIFLACVLCLFVFAACGGNNENTTESGGLDLDIEDLCYETTGIPGDTVLFTADGEDVTASLYFYWLAYNIYNYEYYASYYDDVTYDMEADGDSLKDESVGLASQYVIVPAKIKEMGYSLSDEQIEEINTEIEETIDEYGGEEAFQKMLKESGIDEDIYRMFIESSYYADILEEHELKGHPTEEELETYIENNDLMYMKHILILTVDDEYNPLSDDEKAEKLALAEDLLDQLKTSDDIESTFDELMNEYGEDTGIITYPDGYLFTSGDMVEPVENAVRELEYGQLSDIVEYDGSDDGYYSGYHIILRLDPADYADIDEEWAQSEMSDIVTEWVDGADYEYSKEWDKINVADFYEKYSEYQTAFAEASDSYSEGSNDTDVSQRTSTDED